MRMERHCAACGAAVLPEGRFCGACGARLTPAPGDGGEAVSLAPERFASPRDYTPKHLAEKIRTSRETLDGERKLVTVLFADMKGSMELLADRDPEEARRLLDPVLEHMMEAVHRYEGTVNQVMGDGIMAIFGAPISHEDHAIRACYAALRMHERVALYAEDLRRNKGIDVLIRIGLNSGEVVVRSISSDLRMHYSALGQTSQLASRLEQLARPGTSLMTPDTLRLAEGYVAARSLGPVPVKGMAEPVEVFEVVGVGPMRSRLAAASARGLSPFIGREPELEHLAGALERAEGGRGQVVAVIGEPGVGKSRLYWEFTRSHRATGWLTLAGDSVSFGRNTAFLPIVQLLKEYFQIDERDDPRRIKEKVTGKLITLDEALQESAPALLDLLGLPADGATEATDPARRRQRRVEAVRGLVLRESRVQPLILMLENLHWADAETQALLGSLVDAVEDARVLLLLNYRPEYTHRFTRRPYYSELRLAPLPTESAGELAEALLGRGPDMAALRKLLVGRTEGNPFFLEESIRSLEETRVLAGEPGAYHLAQPLGSIRVPPTVQAVLAARIDRLAEEDKHLLQAAAVIGKQVPVNLLRRIIDAPAEKLRAALERLETADFLAETSPFPDIEYDFRHALTHQVAYGGLLQERRRGLHGQILEALETMHRDRQGEHVDLIAEHAVRGEVWPKAVIYLRAAGARAASRAANLAAIEYFERALSVLARLPESRETAEQRIDLQLDLRPPLLQLGRLPDALERSKDAERLAEEIHDESRLARVYTYLVNYHYLTGEPDRAIAYGERCLSIGEATGDVGLQALARGYMGYSYHAQGQLARARDILRENVERLEGPRSTGDPAQLSLSHIASCAWLAFTLADLGDFDEAERSAARALRAADADRNAYGQAIATSMAGLVALRRGALDVAIPSLERSLGICRDKGLAVWRPIPSALLGSAFVQTGRSDDGMPLTEAGVSLSEELGVRAYAPLWTVYQGEAYLAAGQLERAEATGRRALELARLYKEQGHEAWALRLLGDIAARQGALDPAAEHYGLAAGLARDLAMRPLRARVELALGRLHQRAGRRAEAERHLSLATSMLFDMDMRLWLEEAADALLALGSLVIVARDRAELFAYLERRFAGGGRVQILLDRRHHGEAAGTVDVPPRRTLDLSEALRTRGLVMVDPWRESTSAS
ncbi:MAG: AAA family ATPase [Candidatus Rokubacteria bacterium]|nr:AAA family ATPase [Candidatus Rokubacteria bacterium]